MSELLAAPWSQSSHVRLHDSNFRRSPVSRRRGEHQAVLTPSVCASAQIVFAISQTTPRFGIAPIGRSDEDPFTCTF